MSNFVLFLKLCKDNDIRLGLLKLVGESANSLSLAISTQKTLALKTDNNLIKHQSKKKNWGNKQHQNSFKNANRIPTIPYWLCRDLHYVVFCSFKNYKCSA